jgi:type IV secretory pathway TrbL component
VPAMARRMRALPLSCSTFFLTAIVSVFLCVPCLGWWGKDSSQTAAGLDSAQAKAAEAWTAANETQAAATAAIAKAESMQASAKSAETAAQKAKKGSFFGKKTGAEDVEILEFAAKKARALGSQLLPPLLCYLH